MRKAKQIISSSISICQFQFLSVSSPPPPHLQFTTALLQLGLLKNPHANSSVFFIHTSPSTHIFVCTFAQATLYGNHILYLFSSCSTTILFKFSGLIHTYHQIGLLKDGLLNLDLELCMTADQQLNCGLVSANKPQSKAMVCCWLMDFFFVLSESLVLRLNCAPILNHGLFCQPRCSPTCVKMS